LGKDNAEIFERLFSSKGMGDGFLRVAGETRVNIKLVDERDTTDVNLPGFGVRPEDFAGLEAKVRGSAGVSTAILSGSLPAGCPGDAYAILTAGLKARGARVLLDADGDALAAALAGKIMPECIKPNGVEFAQWLGRPAPLSNNAMIAEAQELLKRGMGLVVISLGAEGALFIGGEGVLHAAGHVEHVHSTVGAGDAMMAGIAATLEEGASLERIARVATAFSVVKLGLAGANIGSRDAVEKAARDVVITRV
jgi:1-phosphofructokinase